MSNFSQKSTRLDTTRVFPKALSAFLVYYVMVFFLYEAISLVPTGNPVVPQSFSGPVIAISTTREFSAHEVLSSPWADSQLPWPKTTIDLPIKTEEFLCSSEGSLVPLEKAEISKVAASCPSSPIPTYLYLHHKENSDALFGWVPELLEQKVSENDILVDLSSAIDPEFAYELSEHFRHLVSLAVEYESNDQPFLGQVLVAEGIISRIRIGVYGPDINQILIGGYEAEADADGNLHFYRGSREILEASESVKEALDLALSGSRFSYLLLQAATEFRNKQSGLQLDETYYQWGSIYHFSPNDIRGSRITERSINRVPVSFHYGDHIFYGYWLSKSSQLDL